MTILIKGLLICTLGVSIFGCSQQKAVSNHHLQSRTTIDTTSKDPTLAHKPITRSGPAYSQPGFRHVLAKRTTTLLQDESPSNILPSSSSESIQVAKSISVISFSIYEMQIWERFCGSDRMNSRDWEFISTSGRDNMPNQLQDTCNPPAYTRQDYLSAWEHSCKSKSLTARDLLIQSQTISPANLCDE